MLFSAPAYTCQSFVEVAFVVDSTTSSRYEHESEVEFIRSVATAFDLSEDGTSFTFTSSSSTSDVAQTIQTKNSSIFLAAVDSFPFQGKNPDLVKALETTYTSLVVSKATETYNAPQTLIILTDRAEFQIEENKKIQSALKPYFEANVKVILVAMTKSIRKVLALSDDALIIAEDFDQLASERFASKVASIGCIEGDAQINILTLKIYFCL